MKTLKWILILAVVVPGSVFAADFLDSSSLNGTGEEVVIDNVIIDNISHEEPAFARRGRERDVAQIDLDGQNDSDLDDWQGELTVLSEIPYSYPQLSRHTLEARVLNEIQAKKAKSQ